eukprot:6403160-Amphidinium_carterae.1
MPKFLSSNPLRTFAQVLRKRLFPSTRGMSYWGSFQCPAVQTNALCWPRAQGTQRFANGWS